MNEKPGGSAAVRAAAPASGARATAQLLFASSSATSFSSTSPVASMPLSRWKAAMASLVLPPMTPSAPPAS